MIVTSHTVFSRNVATSRKSGIARQIRRLEAKKQKLIEKLAGKDSSESSAPEPMRPSAIVVGDSDSGKIARTPGTENSSSATVAEFEEDPKDILKMIQLLEMQIMVLRQQLGDDARSEITAMDEEENTDAANTAAANLLEGADPAELPAAEATDGHVNGYA